MFEVITNLFPRRFRNHFSKLVLYSRFKIDKENFLGTFLVMSLGISLLVSFVGWLIFRVNFLLLFLVIFILILVNVYFIFLLRGDAVGRSVEEVLPDALQLMTSNLRAGMTTDRALLSSVRPEFGALGEELESVGRSLALGGEITEALMEMPERIKSEKFKKAVILIVSGLKSGGELTDLLEQVAGNLRKGKFVDEKIRTNILMYVIFIFVAIGIAAPILFGLSSFLITVLQENLGSIDIPTEAIANLPISFNKVSISLSFILFFSVVSLITTSILGSLVLGLMAGGREQRGIKYMPILVIMSLAVFFLSRFLISKVLGGLFGF